jgi:hypothetical protein
MIIDAARSGESDLDHHLVGSPVAVPFLGVLLPVRPVDRAIVCFANGMAIVDPSRP